MRKIEDKAVTNLRTYTVDDIARILKIGRTSAYRLVEKKYFKSVTIGTAIRISRSSFDTWLDEQIEE